MKIRIGSLLNSCVLIMAPLIVQAENPAENPADKPNILLIMSDDMGFSDIGCYGGEIETPHLDELAENGIRFTQFYNYCRCCPTRASLMTGLYPHQAGMGHMEGNYGIDSYRGNINRRCVTIAEVLRESGYRTYLSGKWHLTRFRQPDGPKHTWPRQRGFDKFYGTIHGGGSFYDPVGLCRDNQFITPENDPQYQPETFYYTDAISDNAVAFVEQHQQNHADRQFFMYVSYTAAHWPMHALKKDIAKYRGRYDSGYESVISQRVVGLRELGIVDNQWALPVQTPPWQSVKNKAWETRLMEVYAAMIDNMDQGIGRLVNKLRQCGQLENTLIIFLQDNGACAENMGRNPAKKVLENMRPLGRDGLQTKIWPPMQTRDGRPVRVGPDILAGAEDTFIAYGRNWASVSNTPFREFKHWVHEGGISTPLILHWPLGIAQQQRGTWNHTISHLIDIMPTVVDVAGASYPSTFHDSKPISAMEGMSLSQTFGGNSIQREKPLYWEHEGNRAIRDGRWKLVAKHKQPWELYDMKADRTETKDLGDRHRQRVTQMAEDWQTWADRIGVVPFGSWKK